MIGLLLMAVTAGLFLASAVTGSFMFARGRIDLLAKIVKVCLVWGAAYFSLLIGTSASSHEIVLERAQRKAFCGAFLDCHLGVSVTKTWRSDVFVSEDSRWVADGTFLFVEIEVTSDAEVANLRLRNPRLDLVTTDGRRFDRARHIEFELATRLGQPHSLQAMLGPAAAMRKTLVYNIPADVSDELRIHATNGEPADRFVELFLIGDEDSLFHRPVLLEVAEPKSQNGLTSSPSV